MLFQLVIVLCVLVGLVIVTDLNQQPCTSRVIVEYQCAGHVASTIARNLAMISGGNVSQQLQSMREMLEEINAAKIVLKDQASRIQAQVVNAQIGALEARDAVRDVIGRLPLTNTTNLNSSRWSWSKDVAIYGALSWIMFTLLSPKESRIGMVFVGVVWIAAAFAAHALDSVLGMTLCASNAILQITKILFV